jgi:tight adherence protein B
MTGVVLIAALAAGAGALAAGPIARRPAPSRAAPTRADGTGARRDHRWATPGVRGRRLGPVAVAAGLAAGLAVALVLLTAGPVAAVTSVVSISVARRAVRRRRVRRRADQLSRASVDVLRALAAELAAGADPRAALAAAIGDGATGDIGTEPAFAALLEAVRRGEDPTRTVPTGDVPALRDLAAAWRVCQHDGLRLAPVAVRLADVARAQATRRAEVRAALAGPRASGRLLAALPVVGVALAGAVGGSPVRFLFGTTPGGVCALAGLALDVAGTAWLSRLADRAEAATGQERGAARPAGPVTGPTGPMAGGRTGPAARPVAGRIPRPRDPT